MDRFCGKELPRVKLFVDQLQQGGKGGDERKSTKGDDTTKGGGPELFFGESRQGRI